MDDLTKHEIVPGCRAEVWSAGEDRPHQCADPEQGTRELPRRLAPDDVETVPVCGVHLAASEPTRWTGPR